jgi:hypothetical protein
MGSGMTADRHSNTPFTDFPQWLSATKTAFRWVVGVSLVLTLQACAVVAVADAAATVVATGVKVTAKAVRAVADAVIP